MTEQATVDAWASDCPDEAEGVEKCPFCKLPVEPEAQADHYSECSAAPSDIEY
jgi:hypothetical protein